MQNQKSNYKWEARTLEGFIQQLAVAYVARGYFFYVTGLVPSRMSTAEHDRRLLTKFDVAMSKWARYRRRRSSGADHRLRASVQYLRHGQFWVLLATHGEHRFFAEHERRENDSSGIVRQYRDVREAPIVYGGYSVSWRGRTSVRISPKAYQELKQQFVSIAISGTASSLEREFRRAPFEPYAGVTRQMFSILRAVNRARKTGGLPPVRRECVRVKRNVVRPFDNDYDSYATLAQNETLPLAA